MPMTHSGPHPIEYYYPGGFGQTASNCRFAWVSTKETIPNPIFENQRVGSGAKDCVQIGVKVNYTDCLDSVENDSYVTRPGTSSISAECCYYGVGAVKYAVLGGEFPPSLYLDIDTGRMMGLIDGLEKIAPERLGLPPNFKFNESNYRDGAVSGLKIQFLVRAFDSGATSVYDDRMVEMHLRTNWSARRDRFILNIENQFYLDEKPVTNEEFLKGMKRKGYYPGPGCQ